MSEPRTIVPVILAGGKGTRLRPLTSETRPKPFLKLFSKYSLLQETALRVAPFEAPVIVCDSEFAQRALEELEAIGRTPGVILSEPSQRSTAAAIALAALGLKGKNFLMAVMPSDHYIPDSAAFQKSLQEAATLVEESGMAFLAVPAEKPDTRYGYIRTDEEGKILQFIEKPTRRKALSLAAMQDVYWNTGIFIIRPACLLELFERHAPAIYAAAQEAIEKGTRDGAFFHPDKEAYAKAPSTPIDRAVMEKTSGAKLVPLETTWHDIGCWQSLLRIKLLSFLH